jgi:hypothetical protein
MVKRERLIVVSRRVVLLCFEALQNGSPGFQMAGMVVDRPLEFFSYVSSHLI